MFLSLIERWGGRVGNVDRRDRRGLEHDVVPTLIEPTPYAIQDTLFTHFSGIETLGTVFPVCDPRFDARDRAQVSPLMA